MSLKLLFEDAESLVIDKPAGLAVDRPRVGCDSLEARLPELRLGFARAPMIAHRLDRDTSGCLLLARNPKALRRFMAAFEARTVAKTYLAVVSGAPADGEGTIALPLAKTSTRAEGWRMIADARGKPAVTHWRAIGTRDGLTLLALTPETGRTHQLRVHCATGLGLPILGDPVYGRADPRGMMLHARRLTMPRGDKPPIDATAPLPDRFLGLGFADDADG